MPTSNPVERIQYATSTPEEARQFLDQAYGARLKLTVPGDDDWTVTFDQVQAGGLTSVDLAVPADISYQVAGRDDDFVFATVLDGTAELDRDQLIERYRPGDVYLGIDQSDYISKTSQIHLLSTALPATLLADVASTDPNLLPAPVKFVSRQPVTAGADRWRTASRFVDDLLDGPDVAAAPLVIGAAARMLAAVALATFPNTAVTEPTVEDRRDAHPSTVRRAVAFIESHPDIDLTVVDIARAAFVTPRAVQLAFRRHLNTTPMAYLRRVRLGRAHAELQAASPDDGTTVTTVAARWGFAQPSRFSAVYRAAYGRQPRDTLVS